MMSGANDPRPLDNDWLMAWKQLGLKFYDSGSCAEDFRDHKKLQAIVKEISDESISLVTESLLHLLPRIAR